MSVPAFTMTDLMEILIAKVGLPREAATDDEEATLADVELDSLALLQLKAEIADCFGVEVDDVQADATFGEILTLVNEGSSEHAR